MVARVASVFYSAFKWVVRIVRIHVGYPARGHTFPFPASVLESELKLQRFSAHVVRSPSQNLT